MADAHIRECDELLAELNTDAEKGLSDAAVAKAQALYGFNELVQEESTPLWKLVLEQFDDLLVKILLGAAVMSFFIALFEGGTHEGLAAFVEPIVILTILVINAGVGVWQESNAENALEALKKLQPRNAKTYRNGVFDHELPARELVPGDIVEVHVGDKIPADLRIIKLLTTTLRIDESALTGESATVLKEIDTMDAKHKDTRISSKKNCLFAGTTATGGKCLCVVTQTGMTTEIGKIQEAVSSEEDDKTPLKIKLDEFGELLTRVIGIICIAVWVMNYKQFFDPVHGSAIKGCIYYLKIAVALGVAAIPEGLPAVITLCLALGTRKMVQKNAIVRKLPSVETLGCTTVICSDKTGTLTMNEMTCVSLVYAGKDVNNLVEHEVTGLAYNPTGEVKGLKTGDLSGSLLDISRVATLCNDARIKYDDKEDAFIRIGEPTEAALKVLAEKMGTEGVRSSSKERMANDAHDFHNAQWDRMAVLEFSRGRKSMSVIARPAQGGENTMFVKGAPENVLSRCTQMRLADGTTVPMSTSSRANILKKVEDLASRPLRTLALAVKEGKALQHLADYDGEHRHPAHHSLEVEPDKYAEIEDYLVWVGLVGIKDPPRPQVAPSIAACGTAGIRVIMITGDNKETAESIAREIGIFTADEDIRNKSFEGRDFMAKDPKTQTQLLMQGGGGRVFSRTDPKDKQRLVNLLKAEGEIAAMTGDGVNDAPALKAASIGIAMGITGTEVAKEASDMVLADDNFATIVSAVEEGRAIYSNMKAFIRYLISSNIGEVASIFFTAALGLPEGLVPVQLLWVNLVTDGPPATALGFNPPDPDIMKLPPRRADDQLINSWVFFRYMVIGIYVGFATVGIFAYWFMYYEADDNHTLVTFDQLSHWGQCPTWENFKVNDVFGFDFQAEPCHYFTDGKVKASTLSLSVLVLIEMLNALNAISEDGSLLTTPPWVNPWLLLAIVCSMLLHFVILYIPVMASIFELVPLTFDDWALVCYFSFPVILIDEVLKFVGRIQNAAALKARMALAAKNKKAN